MEEKKHLQDGNVNISLVQKTAQSDEENAALAEASLHKRLDTCLSHHVEDKRVQNNLREAFHDTGGIGNKESAACVLLSLSKDPMVVQAHKCICDDEGLHSEASNVESDFGAIKSLVETQPAHRR